MQICKQLDIWQEWLLPNINKFLVFLIIYEWDRIFESAFDKLQSFLNYFSVRVFMLLIGIQQKILRNFQ